MNQESTVSDGAQPERTTAQRGRPVVSVSFAQSQLEFARNLVFELRERGFQVFADDARVYEPHEAWGKDKIELIDEVFGDDPVYCILLLSADYVDEKWAGYRRCRILKKVVERQDFILPVHIGPDVVGIRGITDSMFSIKVEEADYQTVVEEFVRKCEDTRGFIEDPFTEYENLQEVIRVYLPNSELSRIDRVRQTSAKVGFELHCAREDAFDRSSYFVQLYGGIAIRKTAEAFLLKHGELVAGKDWMILMPKERRQKQPAKRLKNVAEAFGATNVSYITDFVWKHCTTKSFRENLEVYDNLGFVEPEVELEEGRTDRALESIQAWYKRDSDPLLILHGSGGIGKTTLAQEFSNKLIRDYGRNVLFVDRDDIVHFFLKNLEELRHSFKLYHIYKAYCHARHQLDQSHDLISPDVFRVNFDTGNIAIIIDGLDEVVSRLGRDFDTEVFIKSIREHSGRLGHGKVIVTCRNHFLSEEDLEQTPSLQLCPFDEALATKYFRKKFPHLHKAVQKGLSISKRLTRDEHRDYYIPFVLDVVSFIIQDQALSDDVFADPSFNSSILRQDIENDYILHKICAREEWKYERSFTADEQVEFLTDFAVRRGGTMKLQELKRELQRTFSGRNLRIDKIRVQAMADHPLLIERSPGFLTFRYDLLESHFKSVLVGQMLATDGSGLDRDLVDVLAEKTRANSGFTTDCAMRIDLSIEELTLKVLESLEYLADLGDEISEQARRQATSSLFLIALETVRQSHALDRNSATQLMKGIFEREPGCLEGVMMSGGDAQLVFDFSGLEIRHSWFSSFDGFWRSKFDERTTFKYCQFDTLHLSDKVKTTASRDNFDLDGCQVDDSVHNALNLKDIVTESSVKRTADELMQFLRLFYSGGLMRPLRTEVLRSRYRGRIPFARLLKKLKGIEALVEERYESGHGVVRLSDESKEDARRFCSSFTMSAKIKEMIEALEH